MHKLNLAAVDEGTDARLLLGTQRVEPSREEDDLGPHKPAPRVALDGVKRGVEDVLHLLIIVRVHGLDPSGVAVRVRDQHDLGRALAITTARARALR